MFQMLTSFNLKPGITLQQFQQSLKAFTDELQSRDLVESCGPVGKRQSDTILDTDSERAQQYYFLMYFKDRAQSDIAVEYIYTDKEPTSTIHKEVYTNIVDQIFVCWEDVSDS